MPGVLLNVRYEDPLVRYRGEKILDIVRRFIKPPQQFNTNLAVDVFYTLYLPYPLIKSEKEIERSNLLHYQIVKSLIEDPEIKSIRETTLLNSNRSMVIAASIIESIIRELSRSMTNESAGRDSDNESADNREENESNNIDRAVRNAVKKVVSESKLLSKLEQILLGNQAGVGSVLDFDESAEEIIRLSRSVDISKLLEILENLPDVRSSSKKRKVRSSKGEVEGYEEGSDIERIVPSELAYPLEYIYVKTIEGRLLLYEKKLTLSTGPIYVLMDKSGSMDGDKIRWAKATTLALLMRARREGRMFAMRFFDTTPYTLIRVSKRAKLSEIVRLIDYLSRIRSGGGTDITRALITAAQDIRNMGHRAPNEVILITDGEDKIAENIVGKQLKAVDAKLVSVMILGDNPDLRRLSNKYFRVTRLSGSEILRIVEYERE
ncbi:MAG: VWA domain-containing protein [Sulfolobales archaeon]